MKKKHIVLIGLILICLLTLLQINKRNSKIENDENLYKQLKSSNSPFSKLITQRSVYRDSIYRIYIANINDTNKIIVSKEGNLTSMQENSKFFMHVYPVNKDLLNSKSTHIPLNFDSNFQSILLNGKTYHFASQNLPEFEISKLNLGQFGYKGNNQINWKISDLLFESEIAFILKDNDEEMSIFKPNLDNF